jgi:DNA-binding Lrp family transcriptional regulator
MLDKIDLAIINYLMNDGRNFFSQIAKEIGVSTSYCRSKV